MDAEPRMTQDSGLDREWLEMEAAWKRIKSSLTDADWDSHPQWDSAGFQFTRELNPDGRYKIICNGKRVVEQGETKPL